MLPGQARGTNWPANPSSSDRAPKRPRLAPTEPDLPTIRSLDLETGYTKVVFPNGERWRYRLRRLYEFRYLSLWAHRVVTTLMSAGTMSAPDVPMDDDGDVITHVPWPPKWAPAMYIFFQMYNPDHPVSLPLLGESHLEILLAITNLPMEYKGVYFTEVAEIGSVSRTVTRADRGHSIGLMRFKGSKYHNLNDLNGQTISKWALREATVPFIEWAVDTNGLPSTVISAALLSSAIAEKDGYVSTFLGAMVELTPKKRTAWKTSSLHLLYAKMELGVHIIDDQVLTLNSHATGFDDIVVIPNPIHKRVTLSIMLRLVLRPTFDEGAVKSDKMFSLDQNGYFHHKTNDSHEIVILYSLPVSLAQLDHAQFALAWNAKSLDVLIDTSAAKVLALDTMMKTDMGYTYVPYTETNPDITNPPWLNFVTAVSIAERMTTRRTQFSNTGKMEFWLFDRDYVRVPDVQEADDMVMSSISPQSLPRIMVRPRVDTHPNAYPPAGPMGECRPQPRHRCNVCGQVTTVRCDACRVVYYCSMACQTADWTKSHQHTCTH